MLYQCNSDPTCFAFHRVCIARSHGARGFANLGKTERVEGVESNKR